MTFIVRDPEMPKVTKEKIEYFIKSGWTIPQISSFYAVSHNHLKDILKGKKIKLTTMKVVKIKNDIFIADKKNIPIYKKREPRNQPTILKLKEQIFLRASEQCETCGKKWKGEGRTFGIFSTTGAKLVIDSDISLFIVRCSSCSHKKKLSTDL